MGICSSSEASQSFIDISKEPNWNPNKAWVIDIIVQGSDGEVNSNFLFQADIQADGTVENRTCDKSNEKSYIVLGMVINIIIIIIIYYIIIPIIIIHYCLR